MGRKASIDPIALSIEEVPSFVGLSRTRIFEAVRSGDLIARKAGRSTIIEVDEVKRWLRTLPRRTGVEQQSDGEGHDEQR